MEILDNLYGYYINIEPAEIASLLYLLKITFLFLLTKLIRILIVKLAVWLKVDSGNDNLLKGYFKHNYGCFVSVSNMILLAVYMRFYGLQGYETDYISFKICAAIMPLVLIYIDFSLTASLMYNLVFHSIDSINDEYTEILGDYFCLNSIPIKNMLLETEKIG